MRKVAYIEDIIFMNKQNIPWAEVESYLKQYIGQKYIIEETKDVIHVGSDRIVACMPQVIRLMLSFVLPEPSMHGQSRLAIMSGLEAEPRLSEA